MSRFKDFGSPVDISSIEPIVFKLYNEDFYCHPVIQGKVVLELATLSESDNGSDSATALLKFFSRVLMPESHERFEKLAEDPERIVSINTLSEIVQWLVEEYTGRPTLGLEHSLDGQ